VTDAFLVWSYKRMATRRDESNTLVRYAIRSILGGPGKGVQKI
jgi:hypothetical protein